MKRKTENVSSRFYRGVTMPRKLRYQYLGFYTKFDHFLSKFKEQINMIGSYYIYLSDQRRPKRDHLKKNNLLKEAILIQ